MPATFSQRLWSAFFDALLLTGWILFIAIVRPWPEGSPGPLKAAIWYGPLPLIEPLSIHLRSRTVGQWLVGLRVVSTTGAPPSLARLAGRHALKLALLGLSVLYVPFSERSQALHDRVFGTLVAAEGTPAEDLSEPDPLRLRPFVMSVIWAVVACLAAGTLFAIVALAALEILAPGSSETFENPTLDALLGLVMGLAFLRTILRGAAGRLPGTRGMRPAA